MRTAFIQTLYELAERDERIWLLTGDLGYSVLERFASRFGDRYVNVGVAEQNMTGVAVGLALCGKIVFTSVREGDLDIYSMNSDGTDVRRLTDKLGYDGGPFYSADGSKIVYRAHHPKDEEEAADYRRLLAQSLIRPGNLEIWVMDADGGNKRQITDNGAANFAPFWHPDGKRIIFASNLANPRGRNFDLYLINEDGAGLEQVTFDAEFDSFPMFSSDGRLLVWASNRNSKERGETNVFLAEWVE